MRIGIIHATLNAVQPITDAFKAKDSSIEIVNFVNEELLAHANRVGGLDTWGMRNFLRTGMMAGDAKVNGIVIACTIYSPYADELQQYVDVPVIAVDNPMIVKAVRSGKKIGILATTASSGPSAQRKLLKVAKNLNTRVDMEMTIVTEAMTELKGGNIEKHNELLRNAAIGLKEKGCGVILLSQITMACAKKSMEDLGMEILTSPETGAEEMLRLIK